MELNRSLISVMYAEEYFMTVALPIPANSIRRTIFKLDPRFLTARLTLGSSYTQKNSACFDLNSIKVYLKECFRRRIHEVIISFKKAVPRFLVLACWPV